MAKIIPLQGSSPAHLKTFCDNLVPALNNLTLGTPGPVVGSASQAMTGNLAGVQINGATAVANADISLNHGLKRIPVGYLVTATNVAAHIYTGAAAWDEDNIYLRSDVAPVTFTVFVF
jgi:hypothetical protein